jgi:hypothetical protein
MSPKGPMIQLVALGDDGRVYVWNKVNEKEMFWEQLSAEIRPFQGGSQQQ